jgi:hypothetical protein
MATFNNIKDLERYLNSSKGQSTAMNETEIKKILRDAARELEGYLKDELNAYFNSYDPVVYKRTGNTLKSFRVSQPKKITANEWSIEIYFDDGLANHPSYIGDDQPDGYTPWLLNTGWRTKLDPILDKENFTRFKGTNYVTKAVERFNKSNKHGLHVEVYHNGQDVTDKTYNYGN